MSDISKISLPSGDEYTLKSRVSLGVLTGSFESSSTTKVFVATVPGVTELYTGLVVYIKGVPARAASSGPYTLNVNNLGAKALEMAGGGSSSITTYYAITSGSEYFFIYDEAGDSGNGAWYCVVGGNTNDNTIATYIRYGADTYRGVTKATYRYMLGGINRDGECVPFCLTSNKASANTKTMNDESFDPLLPLWYYNSTSTVSAGSKISTSYFSTMYNQAAYYSYAFNIYSTQNLTTGLPIYLKCVPQSDNQVKLWDSETTTPPVVQSLPSTEDGFVYIFMGIAASGTTGSLWFVHPCYQYKDGKIQEWIPMSTGSSITIDPTPTSGSTNAVSSGGVYNALQDKYEVPSGGIPSSDMASAVQTSLGLADTALQSTDIATTINSSSTNSEVAGALAVYNAIVGASVTYSFTDSNSDGNIVISAVTSNNLNGNQY